MINFFKYIYNKFFRTYIIKDNPFTPSNFSYIRKKHINKYICFENFTTGKIVSYDKDLFKAIKKAKKLGYEHPVIYYVRDPKIDTIGLY